MTLTGVFLALFPGGNQDPRCWRLVDPTSRVGREKWGTLGCGGMIGFKGQYEANPPTLRGRTLAEEFCSQEGVALGLAEVGQFGDCAFGADDFCQLILFFGCPAG
jgi:hypothetical protein